MYIPVQFKEADRRSIVDFVRAHSFGLCVTAGPNGAQATALPFVLHESGDDLTLSAHFARANAQWKELEPAGECLVVFQGAHGYVSPTWYPTEQTTHEHVPTWNYDMVQMRGTVSVTSDPEWLRDNVTDLSQMHEGKRDIQWQVTDAPAEYMDRMLQSIVGFEIRVTDVQAKWKMNQNRLPEDAEGAFKGLSDETDPHHNPAVAKRVHELNHERFPESN